MKTVSARQANRPYRPPLMTAERKRAIQRAVDVMAKGLSWGDTLQRFEREEMHER